MLSQYSISLSKCDDIFLRILGEIELIKKELKKKKNSKSKINKKLTKNNFVDFSMENINNQMLFSKSNKNKEIFTYYNDEPELCCNYKSTGNSGFVCQNPVN